MRVPRAGATLTLPTLRVGSLPLPRCGRGGEVAMILDRQALIDRFAAIGFIADPQLAMAVGLMRTLQRPLLLEGDAGVGKTEVAKALAAVIEAPLIRLQCYEGLDVNAAVYEWNYQRQLLAIKIWEQDDRSAEEKEQ